MSGQNHCPSISSHRSGIPSPPRHSCRSSFETRRSSKCRTPVPVIGNSGSYPDCRTKSKRSRQIGKISACIIHGEDGRGSLSVQPARPYGSTLWSRCNRIRATLASGRIAIRWQQKNRFRATINGTMSDKTAWEGHGQQPRDSRWGRGDPVPSRWTQATNK
jgi:hypothetical protein